MSRAFQLLIWLTMLGSMALAAPKTEEHKSRPECQDFANDAVFNETKVLGTWPWQMLHHTTEEKSKGEAYCVQLTKVTEQERKDIADHIGKYVNRISLENVVLKMQSPCDSMQNQNRVKHFFYLERNEGVGAYKMLQLPWTKVSKGDYDFDFFRHPLRMKFVEEEYLAMISCVDESMFLMGKAAPRSQEQERRLKRILD